jgi:hypothetical protein
MELDLEGQFADRAYPILASLVTPRPIALVTIISPDGKVNAAPFSFFKVLGAALPFWRSPGRSRRWHAQGHGSEHPPHSRVRGEPRG